MGKSFCAYHPTVPASWYCEACNAYYCAECINTRDIGGSVRGKGTVLHLCPKCSCSSERLAVQNLVEPFWNRLPKFFTYPFNTTVVIFSVVLSLLIALFSVPSLMSFIIWAMLFGALMKYCFAVIKSTAVGRMTPPEIDEETITGDLFFVFKYWALGFLYFAAGMALFFFCMSLGMTFSPVMAMVLFLVSLLILLLLAPASIIVMAVNESLLDAVNPVIFLPMVFRLGSSYFIMYFFLMTLYAAPGVVAFFARPFLPAFVFTFVVALANCYYSIVAHHLMGYVILQHHEDLGYEVEVGDDDMNRISGKTRPREEGHALMSRVNVLIKDGKYTDAITLIQAETGGNIESIELAERYYNLLKMAQKVPEMLEHAQKYLDLLIRARKETAYRTVYLECVAADPGFNPPASVLFRVASSLSECGNNQAALEAYSRFIKESPDDPMAPKAYLLAATIFHEKLHSPEKALKALKRLAKAYPDHEIIPYANKYLRKLEQEG